MAKLSLLLFLPAWRRIASFASNVNHLVSRARSILEVEVLLWQAVVRAITMRTAIIIRLISATHARGVIAALKDIVGASVKIVKRKFTKQSGKRN